MIAVAVMVFNMIWILGSRVVIARCKGRHLDSTRRGQNSSYFQQLKWFSLALGVLPAQRALRITTCPGLADGYIPNAKNVMLLTYGTRTGRRKA